MRILYFSRDYTVHDHRFLSALAETEYTVFFLRLEKRGMQREGRSIPDGVEQVLWSGGKEIVERAAYPQFSNELKQVLERVEPDVVHAGSVQTAALVTAMAGFQPLVTMSWGYDLLMDAERTAQLKADTIAALEGTTVLVCDCQAVVEKAVDFGFDPNRIVKFPWGVDLTHFYPQGRKADRQPLEWTAENFILLSLRAWEPIYDVKTIVRGFYSAVQKQPQLRLILLGGGSQASQLQQMLLDAGVTDKVHFGGRVGFDELPCYYRTADIYLSASLTDGSSVSLMEALACGKPAILSDIPGNQEWIDQSTGWFFPVGDWEALSDTILQAYHQREKVRSTMRLNARVLAEQRADWQKNFAKLLDAYQMAMEIQHGI